VLVEYLPIALLFAVATAFVVLSVAVSSKLGPSNPNPAKRAAYESGIIPEPETAVAGSRFPVRFYLVAMLFIIFDVEAVFLYPWATVLGELSWYGLAVMGVFLALLLESYFYVVRKGGLDWEERASSRTASC
jgi:NADH-quinone oxidoreductase subunit A